MIRLGTDNEGNPAVVDMRSTGNILIGGEGKSDIIHAILEQCELQGANVFWVDKVNYDKRKECTSPLL